MGGGKCGKGGKGKQGQCARSAQATSNSLVDAQHESRPWDAWPVAPPSVRWILCQGQEDPPPPPPHGPQTHGSTAHGSLADGPLAHGIVGSSSDPPSALGLPAHGIVGSSSDLAISVMCSGQETVDLGGTSSASSEEDGVPFTAEDFDFYAKAVWGTKGGKGGLGSVEQGVLNDAMDMFMSRKGKGQMKGQRKEQTKGGDDSV